MTTAADGSADRARMRRTLELVVRVGIGLLFLALCAIILRPALIPALWAIIIAIASHPVYVRIEAALGGRRYLAAAVFVALGFLTVVLPAVLLAGSVVENVHAFIGEKDPEKLRLPPPPESLGEVPLVGKWITSSWQRLAADPKSFVRIASPHLKDLALRALHATERAAVAVLELGIGLLVAGVLLANAARSRRFTVRFVHRLSGPEGAAYAEVAEGTLRAVIEGVIGVALIQSVLAGLSFMAVGIPASGVLALLCLVCSVVQLGTLPVMIPAAIYVFATASLPVAIVFLAWAVFVGTIDNVLKPLLFARGGDTPMAVVFLGSIGGLVAFGIIGLIAGAVLLAVGYAVLLAWLGPDPEAAPEPGSGPEPEPGE